MRLMRRTKQGLTAAAVLALISGGGVTVLTNNAMTRQIDQMAAELWNRFKHSRDRPDVN